MAVNQVIYGGTTLVDLTDATATASDIASGITAYSASGELLTGTMETPTAMTDAEILAAVQEGWV